MWYFSDDFVCCNISIWLLCWLPIRDRPWAFTIDAYFQKSSLFILPEVVYFCLSIYQSQLFYCYTVLLTFIVRSFTAHNCRPTPGTVETCLNIYSHASQLCNSFLGIWSSDPLTLQKSVFTIGTINIPCAVAITVFIAYSLKWNNGNYVHLQHGKVWDNYWNQLLWCGIDLGKYTVFSFRK